MSACLCVCASVVLVDVAVVKREGDRNIGVFVRDVLCCCAVLRLGGRTGRDQQ